MGTGHLLASLSGENVANGFRVSCVAGVGSRKYPVLSVNWVSSIPLLSPCG